jgi:hypothetical protein
MTGRVSRIDLEDADNTPLVSWAARMVEIFTRPYPQGAAFKTEAVTVAGKLTLRVEVTS